METYVALLTFSQVVGEVLSDVLNEAVGVFRIQVEHLVQTPQIDALQVAVRQSLDVSVRLYDKVTHGHVCANQVALAWSTQNQK